MAEQKAARTHCAWALNFLTHHSSLVTVHLLALACLLSACASGPKPSAIERDAATLQRWQASGRLSATGADSGGSGSFVWTQNGAAAVVQLRGPVGIGGLRLSFDDQALRVETSDGRTLRAEAAREELAARLGADVPTHALRYWLVGVPAPGEHEWQTDERTLLMQDQWRIDYQRFDVADGVRLPTRLVAVSGPAKVRIVIDRWRVRS